MTDLNRTARRWAALAALAPLPLLWPGSGVAQAPAPAPAAAPTTAAERAQRDAERVFEFIKFHTLRPAKTIEPPRPARPPAAAPAPAAAPERAGTPTRSAQTAQPDAPAKPAATLPATELPTKPTASLPASEPPPTLQAAPIKAPEPTALPAVQAVPSAPPPAAVPAPETEADDADDGALQLQSFVAPVLTPAVQSTLGAGVRNIKVRFTVEADGRVSQAEAAAGVPKRLARPATDAILQWRFAPLPQPRTVDVEIAFRRD